MSDTEPSKVTEWKLWFVRMLSPICFLFITIWEVIKNIFFSIQGLFKNPESKNIAITNIASHIL